MVEYIKQGDIFNLEGVVNYAHGCNCAGAMGKGIALQFKKKYPKMYTKYKELCLNNSFNLGDVFEYDYGRGYVFNLGTQKHWKTKAELTAIESSIDNMLYLAEKKNLKKIALPRIGAGLGGLNWEDVKEKINSISKKHPEITLFIIEEYKKA